MVISYPATWHRRRNIAIPSSADKIYVTIGSNSDADAEDPPLATVLQANIDGTSERPDLVACTKTPDVLFEAHFKVKADPMAPPISVSNRTMTHTV
jgi:hypothetical protein